MTPEQWQQIERLFDAALEREPGERAAFLDQACADNPALRKQVEALIAADEQAAGFMQAPAVEAATKVLAEDHAEPVQDGRIGVYQIKRELGRGGMGVVYLAARADQEYHRQVAIKLIKHGMGTDFTIRRFRQERQILASLNHPNIAKLLDGGTTEQGQPYLVMEYIEGMPIDQYCDRHKLSTGARLKLFRTVCSAVQYAHQNLVVHRDIKPSNILVTADGTPKLLDFGIAKLLNPDLSPEPMASTVPALRAMTPEYASPEQIRGDPMTTASDVYSLGVVLYELLTGHRPYRLKSRQPLDVMRAVCEEEPEKPSTAISREEEAPSPTGATQRLTPESVSQTREGQPEKLRRRLKGDIDNIVLMALRKEPMRRYASVEQLSEDIRRHLEGRPVMARKVTLAYRAGKFIKRNTASVVAVALVIMSLVGGTVMTTRQARIAERRFNDVRALTNSFLFEFHDAIKELPGSTPARELVVKRALEYLDRLSQEADDDPSLKRELATAYERVGDVQGNPTSANLGDTAGAMQSYRQALAIREALYAQDSTNVNSRRELASSFEKIGDMLRPTGDLAGALESYRKALPIREALAAADSTNAVARRNLGVVLNRIGDMQVDAADLAGALESYRKALAIFEGLAAADPANAVARRDLATSHLKLADMQYATGDPAGALQSYRQSLTIREALAAADPNNANTRRSLAVGYLKTGDVVGNPNFRNNLGKPAEAVEYYRKALTIFEGLAAADPANAVARRDLTVAYQRLGDVLAETGSPAQALESFRKALAIQKALAAADPANVNARRDSAISYIKIAGVLSSTGDRAGALENQRQALAIFEALAAEDPTNAQARQNLARSYHGIGDALQATGDLAGAVKSYRQAVTILEALLAKEPMDAEARADLVHSYSRLGELLATLGANTTASLSQRVEHWQQARSWYQRSLDVLLDMRRRGLLTDTDANRPDSIAREIATCDAALAKLK